MNKVRKIRLQNAIRSEIMTILRRYFDDPRLGFITITEVEISKDDKYAYVHYSVLGSASQREKTSRMLSASSKRITKFLFQRLQSRSLPMLRFKFDTTPSRVERLEHLFHEKQDEVDDQS